MSIARACWALGLLAALGACTAAIFGANVLLILVLAGVGYLLSRPTSGTPLPAGWTWLPPLAVGLIVFAVGWIAVADLVLSGNSTV